MSTISPDRISVRRRPPVRRSIYWDSIIEDIKLGIVTGLLGSFVGLLIGIWIDLQWADYTQNYRFFSTLEELKNYRIEQVKVSILIFFVMPISLVELYTIGMSYNNSVMRKYSIYDKFEKSLKISARASIVGLLGWNCVVRVTARDILAWMPSEVLDWCKIYCLLWISTFLSVPNTISLYRIFMNLPSAYISCKIIAYLISNYIFYMFTDLLLYLCPYPIEGTNIDSY